MRGINSKKATPGAYGKQKWLRKDEWHKASKVITQEEKKESFFSTLKNIFKKKDRTLSLKSKGVK